jgi:hypothetical protein
MKLGSTGDYPRGKLTADDEGALKIGITVKDKTLIIAFGKEVAWIGLDKSSALDFAALIKRRAEEL